MMIDNDYLTIINNLEQVAKTLRVSSIDADRWLANELISMAAIVNKVRSRSKEIDYNVRQFRIIELEKEKQALERQMAEIDKALARETAPSPIA